MPAAQKPHCYLPGAILVLAVVLSLLHRTQRMTSAPAHTSRRGEMFRRVVLVIVFAGIVMVTWSAYSGWVAGLDGLRLWRDRPWWIGWVVVSIGFAGQWLPLFWSLEPRDFTGTDVNWLTIELTELNERGRHYGSQLWHVPFAYVGIVGAVMSQVAERDDQARYDISLMFLALVASALFGIIALLHMTSLIDGNRRAVAGIQGVENALHVPPTAEYHFEYVLPLLLLVILTVATCACGAMFLQVQ